MGAGAVLLQEDDAGVVRPVSFFSKKFNGYQANFLVIKKEALALVWALQHFEVYVGGAPLPDILTVSAMSKSEAYEMVFVSAGL